MDAKIALVSSVMNELGFAIAKRLATDGHVIIAADACEASAARIASQLKQGGFISWPLAMDVHQPASIAEAFSVIQSQFGRCDILINNANFVSTNDFWDSRNENWQQTLDVNLTAPMTCGQHAAHLMRRQGWGRIVNFTSIAGIRANVGRAAYGTSKAAVIGLTRQMAVELAPYGITANAISAGPVDTQSSHDQHSDTVWQALLRGVPANRYCKPEEIAGVVSFLASEDAAYVNGHTIPVDGGFTAAGILDR